jgi:uncharacterized repeat protein (TIGR01451 family)
VSSTTPGVTVTLGTCTPPAGSSLAPGASISCGFTYRQPNSGTVTLVGTTSTTTPESNPNNNSTTATVGTTATTGLASGVVYSSLLRTPVAGATVTLQGPPGFDPARHLLGGTAAATQVTQAGGSTVVAGGYAFTLLNAGLSGGAPAGTYTLVIQAPAGFRAPATQGGVIPACPTLTVAGSAGSALPVQPQTGAPAAGVSGGACSTTGQSGTQYFLTFTISAASGNVTNNHIPLDPLLAAPIFVEKTAGAGEAELGQVVPYTIRVRSPGGINTDVTLTDRIPRGFIYVPGSLAVDGQRQADPSGAPGPVLSIPLGSFSGDRTITYRLRVGVGAAEGDGVNRARAASAGGAQSNEAIARVRVKRGVFTTDACVVGKVFVDCNGNSIQDREELGIPGVKLLFTDGTYVVTDSEGKYSYCGLPPRTHGLKVDPLTLPRGAYLTTSSNRNALDPNSLFIDLKAAELHRADFIEGTCSQDVMNQVKARRSQGEPAAASREGKADGSLRFRSRDAAVEGTQQVPAQRQTDPQRQGGQQ